MARSHWLVVASWASVFVGVGVACGDSVTGPETVDPETSDDSGTPKADAGTDQSVSVPPRDSSVPDTNKPDTSGVDGGAPSASPAVLDFGEVDCGKTGQPKTFTIQNPSAAPIAWTSSLGKGSSSGFTLAPDSGTLAAGASVIVTVTPKQVPAASSTAANGHSDVLTLALGATNTTIQLKETAHGAILYYSPSNVAFGNTPTAAAPVETAFAIANSGNATANVTLTTTGDPEYAIVGSATLAAVPGLTGSKVKFTPTANQPYTGAVALAVGVNDTLCQPLPANMALTGTGTDGILSVTPPTVSFGANGLVDCGATALAQKVKITNSGNAAVNYTAVLTRGTTVFTVAPASGQVAANSSVDVTVTPKPIPGSTATTPDLFNDTLTVTTDAAGDSPHAITLRETARGAILTRPQGTISFNNVALGTTASQQYSFANAGNVDITVGLANAFPEFVAVTPVTVSAGGFAAPLVSFTPALKQFYQDAVILSMAPAVPLCGALPGNLSLQGTGIAPSLAATPSPLNFGFVPCGTTAAAKTVRITNNGPATTFDAVLLKGAGSPFTISPTTGPMTAGGFIDITVTPKAIPAPPTVSTTAANGFTDVIEVSSGNTPGSPLNVTINETAQGAIIAYNKTTNAFGNVKNGQSLATTVQVTNSGNLSADMTFATTSSAANAFTTSPTTATIANGTNTLANVTFAPVATVSYTGTWFSTTSTTLCAPLPPVVTLTGAGIP